MQQRSEAAADPNQERSRLIDHFKRAYQIIVGLAITLACGKLFASGQATLPDPAFWLFCTFFITVVPIFHGGDRSLDLKYLGTRPRGFWRQAAYVWDVYMLLITAVFFVKIAQAMPGPGLVFVGEPAHAGPQLFYEWTAWMLVFDVGVLAFDWLKSGLLGSQGWKELQAYGKWIILNSLFAAVCFLAAYPGRLGENLSPEAIGIMVFACAFIRTLFDYIFGRKFMFP